MTEFEYERLGRLWTHYIRQRGGEVVVIDGDPKICSASFDARQVTPVTVLPINVDAPAIMLSIRKDGAIERLSVDRRQDIAEQVARNKEKANATIVSLEKRADGAETALGDCQTALGDAEDKINGLNDVLNGPDAFEGVTSFSRFTQIKHPTRPQLDVSTGVSYDREGFPAYTSSWCYINVRNAKGSTVRLDIGEKAPGRSVRWASLNDVGLTRSDVEAARSSCRFPKD